MKKLTVLWIIIIMLLVFFLIFIGLNVSKRTKPYKDLEDTIIEAMKVYYGQDTNLKKLPKKNKITKTTINELEDFGLKLSLEVNGEKCEGYGIVKSKSVAFSYQAFIKCENYTTEEYEKYENIK